MEGEQAPVFYQFSILESHLPRDSMPMLRRLGCLGRYIVIAQVSRIHVASRVIARLLVDVGDVWLVHEEPIAHDSPWEVQRQVAGAFR